MTRLPFRTAALATVGGVGNAAVVLALYARAEYPTLESTVGLAAPVFAVGLVAVLVSASTRLVAPTVGFLAALIGTTYVELTSPMPECGELRGYVVVDGPTYVADYANAWYVWLSLALVAGLLEFAIRRGYGIADGRLRNLPAFPLSRTAIAGTVAGFAGFVGIATALLVLRAGIRPPLAALVVFAAAAAVTAVPLRALLARGLLSPVLLFAVVVPYFLIVEVFVATDSPVHLVLFGSYAVVLSLVGALEAAFRSRIRGWSGGRFVGERPR
ncbi:hypothetical protein [Natronococcus wangiae]|uniref:hypothetical protein n=1 Tax=Natronococcus wangiae TaxID=3068275 RepID=UPI00273D510D|nr:hypothetical protein [Natronococcus sp. AD5]